jgi:WD40 repeat protein
VSQRSSLGVQSNGNWGGEVLAFDLNGGVARTYTSFGPAFHVALDPSETALATGGIDGTVRIGPVSGEEPLLFFGHTGMVRAVAFSPDGRWLASAGEDRTIRLWPVPDVARTPPHALPHEEFLTKLRSWTNLRIVPNPESPNGWQIEVGEFPGWVRVPIW